MSEARPPSALFEAFDRVARADPGRPVIRFAGGEPAISAIDLRRRVTVAAAAMRRAGLSDGGTALLAGLSGAQIAVGVLASWALDGVALLADPGAAPPEIEVLRAAFGPRIILMPGAADIPRAEASGTGRAAPIPPATAVVKFTSGSTGVPRGVAVTADQLMADTRQIIEGMDVRPDDVNVAAIPLSHSYGLASILMTMVLQGSPILLVPSPLMHPLALALSIEDPAVFPGVPFLFEMLARQGAPPIRRRGLRTCLSAGSPLRGWTATAFAEKVGVPVRAFYGTSETGGICFDATPEGDAAIRAEGCVGTPLPGVEVTLEGEDRRVVVSSAAVATGYVGPDPEGRSSDGAFDRGRFRTGDTGRFTQGEVAGALCLTGRADGLVNVSGRKVDPGEIERALGAVPGVRDAAVVGVPDAARGEALAACLVADAGLTRDQVVGHLRGRIAAHKIPRRIVFVEALARNARGKIDREALRRIAGEAGISTGPRGQA